MALNRKGVGGNTTVFLSKELGIPILACYLWILYTGYWNDSKQWIDTCNWQD